MSNDYYTASQAMGKLGLSKTAFHRRVNEGIIPKFTPPGGKQGVYAKRDIDALVQAMNMLFEAPAKFTFSRSTPGDQVEEIAIGNQCFGDEYITPLPERIKFQQKSKYTFWSLKVDGHVVGYVSMMHLPSEFQDDILTGKHIERDITEKEILPFKRLEPFDIYIDVLAMDPSLQPHLRRSYAHILVSRFVDQILDLLSNRYQIRKIYTVTATQEGDNLVRKLGFHLMPGKSVVPGRIAYEIELDEAGIEQLKRWSRRKR